VQRVQHGIDKFPSSRFTRGSVGKHCKALIEIGDKRIASAAASLILLIGFAAASTSQATTGWVQIETPDLQPEGQLALSFQLQDEKLGNMYQLQAEMGLTKWAEVAVFKGFDPEGWIFNTEIGLRTEAPWLLSIGFSNWSPHNNVDPQPYIVSGYYGNHHRIIAGATHVNYRHEALLAYAYDFNDSWQVQVDWQSGSGNSSTIGFTWNVTPRFLITPAIFVTNNSPHEVKGFVTLSYTFDLWKPRQARAVGTNIIQRVAGVK
jgi:hypothetical protein